MDIRITGCLYIFIASEPNIPFSKIRKQGWQGGRSGVCNLYIEPCVPTTKRS